MPSSTALLQLSTRLGKLNFVSLNGMTEYAFFRVFLFQRKIYIYYSVVKFL